MMEETGIVGENRGVLDRAGIVEEMKDSGREQRIV